MQIHYEDDITKVEPDAVLVVYTPAIPAGHKEFNFYKDGGYAVMKRSEVLGIITVDAFNICVAGTHGKTTTTYFLTQMLEKLGQEPGYLIGGIIDGRAPSKLGSKKYFVIESDEYDSAYFHKISKFRLYELKNLILTSLEFDHADIFSSVEKIDPIKTDVG